MPLPQPSSTPTRGKSCSSSQLIGHAPHVCAVSPLDSCRRRVPPRTTALSAQSRHASGRPRSAESKVRWRVLPFTQLGLRPCGRARRAAARKAGSHHWQLSRSHGRGTAARRPSRSRSSTRVPRVACSSWRTSATLVSAGANEARTERHRRSIGFLGGRKGGCLLGAGGLDAFPLEHGRAEGVGEGEVDELAAVKGRPPDVGHKLEAVCEARGGRVAGEARRGAHRQSCVWRVRPRCARGRRAQSQRGRAPSSPR